jgi:hypothetical protein
MPPISGRIAWARQLYEVIDKPMQLLGTQKHIVNTAEGRKIVKNFNRMAAVLVEFEVKNLKFSANIQQSNLQFASCMNGNLKLDPWIVCRAGLWLTY